MNLVIQIRGTSGSGKSTIVHKLLKGKKGFDKAWDPVFKEGRKKPLCYLKDRVLILGHYEIDCGGCDTIGSAPQIYNSILELEQDDYDVAITEGLLWSEDVKWTVKLKEEGFEILSLFLNTPLKQCLEWVEQRQAGRKPADPERVIRKLSTRIQTIERARLRLVQAGVSCRRVSPDQAFEIIRKKINAV